MKRLFDLCVSVLLLILLLMPMLVIALIIFFSSKGPILFWSDRVGKGNKIFSMPKFRTMKINTPHIATHLMKNPDIHLTSIGKLLRQTSFDELPQLYSIIKGDMSIVGPRPALFNQDDLIQLRTDKRVHKIKPGVTGWAQINGRDELSIMEKVSFDCEYLEFQSFWFDMKILWITFLKVINKKDISH